MNSSQSQMTTLQRLLRLMLPYRRWIALAALLGLLTIGSSIGLMALAAYILAAASLQPSIAELQVAIVGVRFFGIGRGVFRYLERLVSHQATLRLLAGFREWFYCGLEPAAPSRLADLDSGELLSRITSDLAALETFYLRVLAPPLIALLTIILSSVLVGSFSVQLGIILAAMMTLSAAAAAGYLSRSPTGRELAAYTGRIKSGLVDHVQGMADLLAFNAEERTRAQLQQRFDLYEAVHGRLAARKLSRQMLIGFFRDGTVLAVLILAIPQVNAGRIEGVYLGFLALAAYASFEALLPLPDSLQQLELSLEAAARLFQIVDLPPAAAEPAHPQPLQAAPHLAFRHVSFQYNPAEDPVLVDLSFDLPPGKRMAVVGPSGSGKTTLLRLILRLWEPGQGDITLNDIPLSHIHTEEIRRAFKVVTQNTFLFNASIAANLKLGAPNANHTSVQQAAALAEAHEFIDPLPDKYDTWLGESGANLSGGEQQRLALARAYLRPGSILLLDEPTSHLDAQTRRRVMETMLKRCRTESLLLITHNLIGLQDMDEILVLSQGKTAERGSHAQLMQAQGLYFRLWQAQHEAALIQEKLA
jgi:ATP-binding cassette, subfamily C, bacterial CydC